MKMLKPWAVAALLSSALGGCQLAPAGAPSGAPVALLPSLVGALGTSPQASRPIIATEGEGLRVRLALPKALLWTSPSPLGAGDVRSLRYELLDQDAQVVAQRTDAMPSGLPPVPPPVLLRNLKPDGDYSLRVLAFGVGDVLISKVPESTAYFSVDEYSGNHNGLSLPLVMADRFYPGRLAVHLGNKPTLRMLAIDRRINDNPVTWGQLYQVFMPAGPSVTTYRGFAPGDWVRVRITPFVDEGDSAAGGATQFEIIQIVAAEADASGTTDVYESE